MIGLIHVADVYTRGSGGAYTVLSKSGLVCRAVHPRGGESLESRAELAASRVLMWQGDYVMPERFIQILFDGERWNIKPETITALPGPAGIEYRRAIMVRAGS